MSVLDQAVLDPEIEQAVAEAIRREPRKWEDCVEEIDVCPRTGLAPPTGATKVTSNPADDQATRLRALIQGEISVPLGGAGTKISPAQGISREYQWAGGTPAPPKPQAEAEAQTKHPTMIAVASGKGGVGKTNIAVNLAVTLAGRGSRITLLDADLGTANADLLCGLTPSARLEHVIQSLPTHDGARRNIRDIAVDAPGGFRLIAGSSGVGRLADLSLAQQRQLLASLNELEDDTDVLIVDTGAGVSRAVTSFVAAADLTIVVTTPEPTAITDAYALIKCASAEEDAFGGSALRAERGQSFSSSPTHRSETGATKGNHGPQFSLVVNQVSGEDEARRVHARLAAVCDRFLGVPLPMLGWVAHDLRLPEAVRARQPLVVRTPRSPAARDIQTIGGTLAQQIGLMPGNGTASAGGSRARGGIAGALARVLRFSAR